MWTCILFVWLCYSTDISMFAVGDTEVGIILNPELRAEIDAYVFKIVTKITERYESRINDLENELKVQNQRIVVLEENEQFLKSILDNQQAKAENVQDTDAEKDSTEKTNPTEPWTTEEETLPITRKDVPRIRRQVDTPVAFYATLTPYLGNMGPNQDIVFDNVLTNLGNGYNDRRGLFLAPVAGTYVFSVTLMSAYSDGGFAHVVVNGNVVAKLDTLASNCQSSQTIVVTLNLGDDVSIQNAGSSAPSMHGDKYVTFSGFLLYGRSSVSEIVG